MGAFIVAKLPSNFVGPSINIPLKSAQVSAKVFVFVAFADNRTRAVDRHISSANKRTSAIVFNLSRNKFEVFWPHTKQVQSYIEQKCEFYTKCLKANRHGIILKPGVAFLVFD